MKKNLLNLVPFLVLVFLLCFGPSGQGQTNKHSITLSWNPSSSSTTTGYHIYRGTSSGGPYTKLDSTTITGTSYVDTTGTGGIKYFYVATSVDSSGSESVFSNEVSAVFLGAPSAPTGLAAVSN